MSRWWWSLVLTLTTLVGLGIRLWGLTAHGAWFDEAYYVYLANSGGAMTVIDTVLASPPSAPLYALSLDAWVAIAGDSDLAIRLPSALAGTTTIPAAAWLARELISRRWPSPRPALLAAALVCLSPFAVQLSQEARPYALGALTLTLAVAAQVRWRRTGSGKSGALAVGMSILAVYSHYLSALVLALIMLAGRGTADRRRWSVGQAIILLAWSPWLVASIASATSVALRTDIEAPVTLPGAIGTLITASAGTGVLRQGPDPISAAGLVLGGALLVLAWRGPAGHGVLVAAAAAVLIPAMASALTGRWLFSPAFLGLVVPILLVAKVMATRLRLSILLLCLWLPLQGAGLLIDRTARWHDDDAYREIAATLEQMAVAGAPILVTPPLLVPGLTHYTDRPLMPLPEAFDPRRLYAMPDPAASQRARDTIDDAIDELAADPPNELWLVYRTELDPDGRLLAGLQEGFAEADRWTYDVADLIVFVRTDARGDP